MDNKNKIKNLILWIDKKQNNDVKKQLGQLIKHIIFLFKNKNNIYPLTVSDVKTIKDDNTKILIPFYTIYKTEIENILIETFAEEILSSITNFEKDNHKYPIISDFNTDIVNTLYAIWFNEKWFLLLMTEYIIKKIENAPKNIRMRQLFKEAYIANQELFKKFIFINLDTSKKYSDFEKIWKEVKWIIEDVENVLLWHMEGWIHWDKSVSVSDKYKAFIKTIFPMYYNIGVITKKLTPEQMKAYIAANNKK